MSDFLQPYGPYGILQARILEWVAMPSSKESSWPRDWNHIFYISCISGIFFTTELRRKPQSSGTQPVMWEMWILKLPYLFSPGLWSLCKLCFLSFFFFFFTTQHSFSNLYLHNGIVSLLLFQKFGCQDWYFVLNKLNNTLPLIVLCPFKSFH